MTKFYEEYFRSSIENLKEFEENIKGEITIVISQKKVLEKKIIKIKRIR